MQILISSSGNKVDRLVSKNDLATRFLLTSGNFSDRVQYQLATHTPNSGGESLVPYPPVKGLPWRERLRSWSRWTTPTGKEDLLPLELKRNPNKHHPKIILSAPTEPRENLKPGRTKKSKRVEKGDESDYWSSDLFTETSVLFGSVLHSPLQPLANPVPAQTLANDSVVHTFSTHVPNISRLLSKAHTKRDFKRGSEIVEHVLHRLVVHFQPNPFYVPAVAKGELMRGPIGPAALAAFPPIEMIFDIADDKARSVKLKYIQAIVNESKKDVMLPGSAVDLRFQQRTTSRLKRRYIDQVNDFLKQSNLNLAGNAPLETPPSITLPISSNICREPGFKLLDGKNSKPSKEAGNNIRDMEYLYTSLEIRRTRAFTYNEWLLLYTSCEAGRAGGSRGELRLRPSKDGKVMQEEDLVSFAYKLASVITKGGEGDGERFVLPSIQRKEARDTRLLSDLRSPPMVVRKVTTEAPEEWHFGDRYFVKRPLEGDGDEDEWVGWELTSKQDGENGDVSESGDGDRKDDS
jgi:hypothetical protein